MLARPPEVDKDGKATLKIARRHGAPLVFEPLVWRLSGIAVLEEEGRKRRKKEEEEHDPMNDVDVSDSESPSKRIKADGVNRVRYYKNACKKSIVEIEFPEHTPEVAKDGKDVRKIRLYIEDRLKVWLHIDDVPWGVKWMYMQYVVKGDPLAATDSSDPSSP